MSLVLAGLGAVVYTIAFFGGAGEHRELFLWLGLACHVVGFLDAVIGTLFEWRDRPGLLTYGFILNGGFLVIGLPGMLIPLFL